MRASSLGVSKLQHVCSRKVNSVDLLVLWSLFVFLKEEWSVRPNLLNSTPHLFVGILFIIMCKPIVSKFIFVVGLLFLVMCKPILSTFIFLPQFACICSILVHSLLCLNYSTIKTCQ